MTGPGGFTARIGLDESGKGDYFGPLVVAAAAVQTPEQEARLAQLKVADSKKLSDGRCRELAAELRRLLAHELVVISPARYNDLYRKLGNVNRLLAWAHARAVENLLGRIPVDLVVADQFAWSPDRLQHALFEKGRRVQLVQRHRAEADLAVAAASVLARARFLKALERLGREAGVALPKGATDVEGPARDVLRRGGVEALGRVAKLHFRTTARLGVAVDPYPGKERAGPAANAPGGERMRELPEAGDECRARGPGQAPGGL